MGMFRSLFFLQTFSFARRESYDRDDERVNKLKTMLTLKLVDSGF